MRSRLGDDAHQDGQQYHPRDIVADEGLDVKVMQPDLDDEQGTEGPEEDAEEMLPDDVLPEMLLDDMLGRRGDEPHHKQTDEGEDEVYPILVEDIELGMSRFAVLVAMLERAEGEGDDEQNHT